jgi:hypothetical protein
MTDETALRQTLDEYYRAVSTLSVQAILPYLNQPALLVGLAEVAGHAERS